MESLTGISRVFDEAASYPSADKFSEAGVALVKARKAIREELQQMTARAMQPIIAKLRQNQPLGAEEKDLVRMWIVGDAAGFTQKENDFLEWLAEFKRLGDAIQQVERAPSTLPQMLDLHGNLEEAVRLAGDIQFFLEEKERLGRFEQAIQNLSKDDAEMLASILQEKLNSPEM
ncbi:MAG: hypothetical protein M1438_17440 [Deltaproteobacteria bacterium]|nr:hypothetical protein [Deltaproteobacteria bacterium]